MRKNTKKMVAGMMAASLILAGITTGSIAQAADATAGSSKALADTAYTLEEMLVYAIEDEYLAQAEYDAIMDEYGVQRPFSNIIKAEDTHIGLLTPLFAEYGIVIPQKDWNSFVSVPDSLEASYEIGVTAEEKNIAMYERFLKEDLPDEVREVFEHLQNASQNHLRAFRNAADGNCTGNRSTSDTMKNRNSNRAGQGRGQGTANNRSHSTESCLL